MVENNKTFIFFLEKISVYGESVFECQVHCM